MLALSCFLDPLENIVCLAIALSQITEPKLAQGHGVGPPQVPVFTE